MKRFYSMAIEALNSRECVEDIEQYVNYIELRSYMLINELKKADTPSGNIFLKGLGYKVD